MKVEKDERVMNGKEFEAYYALSQIMAEVDKYPKATGRMFNNRILHLVLKHKWYDMIASGEKKEEYRDMKPYWFKRLFQIIDGKTELKCTSVRFHRGYTNETTTFMLDGYDIGRGKPEWGADTSKYHYILKLGKNIDMFIKTI